MKDMTKRIETIQKNVGSWYKHQGPNIMVNLLGRTLYRYEGQAKRAEIRSTQAKALETNLHNGSFNYGYSFSGGGFNLGNLGLSGSFISQKSSPLFWRAADDLREHFGISVYNNLIGSLYDTVMGGLTKAEIDVTIQPMSDEYNKQFIRFLEKKTIQANPFPEVNELIEKKYDSLIEQKEDKEFHLNTLSSLLEQSIQKFFNKIENKEALMSCLDNLCTMGYSVLRLKIEESPSGSKELDLDLIENPEKCFFAYSAKKKDKSDGFFCGIIETFDRYQIEKMYGSAIKKNNLQKETLQNFVPRTFPFEMRDFDRDSLQVCYYYEKVEEGIQLTVCCNNCIFEETILEDFDRLPFIFLDSSLSDKWKTTGMFNKCFPFQKEYAETQCKIDKMMLTSSVGKLLVPLDQSQDVWQNLISGSYSDAIVMGFSPTSGINQSFQPTIMQNIDIPPNVLLRSNQLLEQIQYTISGIMASELTKGGGSSGVISGTSRAIGSMNKNNLHAGKLSTFENGLRKLVDFFIEMFYRVYKDSNNIQYRMLKNITEEEYIGYTENLEKEVFYASDSSFNKEITRQSLIEVMRLNQNPILNDILITSYCENLESSKQGELLNNIKEAQEAQAAQAQNAEDPMVVAEMEKLRMDSEEKNLDRQFKAIEAEKDREHDSWKVIVSESAEMLKNQSTHNHAFTQSEINNANIALSQGINLANIRKQNNQIR